MLFTRRSEPCREARAVVAPRAVHEAVRAAVEHHAVILGAVRDQVAVAVAAEARLPSTNTGSMSET